MNMENSHKSSHNYGIDLLRIVLMLLVVSGHLLVHTGVRMEVEYLSAKWILTWGYQSVIVCAVNCFVLITGYFSSTGGGIRVRKIVHLYGEVLLYSLLTYIALVAFGKVQLSLTALVRSVFPFFGGQYWFFSSFLLLLLLVPFVNYALVSISDRALKILVAIITIVFYVAPIFSIVFTDFDPTEGMGIIGFVTLYIIGYALKRLSVKLSKLKCVIALSANCGVIFFSKIVLEYIVNKMQINAGSGLFYHYNTVFQLINAVLLLLLFMQINVKGRAAKVISYVSTSVFGIYLMHEHPAIRPVIWNQELKSYLLGASFVEYACVALLLPVVVFAVCLVIDKVRYYLGRLIAKTAFAAKLGSALVSLENKINENFDKR